MNPLIRISFALLALSGTCARAGSLTIGSIGGGNDYTAADSLTDTGSSAHGGGTRGRTSSYSSFASFGQLSSALDVSAVPTALTSAAE